MAVTTGFVGNNNVAAQTAPVVNDDTVMDGGTSESLSSPSTQGSGLNVTKTGTKMSATFNPDSTSYKAIMHSANLYSSSEVKDGLYNKIYRFGLLNPHGAVSNVREYLFFTKPDLHIMKDESDNLTSISTTTLNDGLGDLPFWADLLTYRKNTTIRTLQNSVAPDDPFNHLLQNQVTSNLEIPQLSAESIETPTNMFGVNFTYRGTSEASDDGPTFSLEFKDTRYLDVYTFFKAYEEYETLKHHGIIRPSKYYICNRILHDQFSIYKFIVAEDAETIIYYGKMYGVYPTSLPRDVFGNTTFDSGLSYSIDFKAAFYEDMKPDILADFNYLSYPYYNTQPYQIGPYNKVLDKVDMRPAKAAYIEVDKTSQAAIESPTGYIYKLKWRGSDKI